MIISSFSIWLRCRTQITLAVMISGWAHVLHALYKPWGTATRTYKLQHLSLFTTTFIFLMGLLFKVNGVSQEGTSFAAMTVIMLTLCIAFAVLWVGAMLSGIVNTMRVKHLPRMARSVNIRRLTRALSRAQLEPVDEPSLLVKGAAGPGDAPAGTTRLGKRLPGGFALSPVPAGANADGTRDGDDALRSVLVVGDEKGSSDLASLTPAVNPMFVASPKSGVGKRPAGPPGAASKLSLKAGDATLLAQYASSGRRDGVDSARRMSSSTASSDADKAGSAGVGEGVAAVAAGSAIDESAVDTRWAAAPGVLAPMTPGSAPAAAPSLRARRVSQVVMRDTTSSKAERQEAESVGSPTHPSYLPATAASMATAE